MLRDSQKARAAWRGRSSPSDDQGLSLVTVRGRAPPWRERRPTVLSPKKRRPRPQRGGGLLGAAASQAQAQARRRDHCLLQPVLLHSLTVEPPAQFEVRSASTRRHPPCAAKRPALRLRRHQPRTAATASVTRCRRPHPPRSHPWSTRAGHSLIPGLVASTTSWRRRLISGVPPRLSPDPARGRVHARMRREPRTQPL